MVKAKTKPKDEAAKPEAAEPKPAPKRTAEEQALIDRHQNRPRVERPPTFRARKGQPRSVEPNPEGDLDLWNVRLTAAFGVKDASFAGEIVRQALGGMGGDAANDLVAAANLAVIAIQEIGPRDGVEAMLAAQMVATHASAMEMLRRLTIAQPSVEVCDSICNRATKLLRTYTAQVEALNRHRNAGKQVITVNHIGQVNAENAAIAVGCTTGEPGGAHQNQSEPHDRNQNIIEHLAVSSLAAMPSYQQANGQALPVCGDGEWGLLPPRRQESRRALRKSA
jgi:hypothetical protein